MKYEDMPKPTAYSTLVLECVERHALGQGGVFTVQDLSKSCNLPLTHNLRKRLHQLVELGILETWLALNDKRRMVNVYNVKAEYVEVLKNSIPF